MHIGVRAYVLILTISILLNGLLIFPFSAPAEASPGDWWNTSWQYRRAATVDHTKISSSLEDFPFLVDIVDAGLKNKIRADGYDVVFVDDAGGKLDHEVESFDTSSGHLVAWVRLPFLNSTDDTTFYMYYGNPSASNQQNPIGVWDANFTIVGHLDESSGTRYDSTQNGNNGVAYGGVGRDASGKIDGAALFDGVNDYLKFSTIVLPTASITIELWLKPSSYSATRWTKYINTGPSTTRGIYGGQLSQTKDQWSLSLSWDSKAKSYTLPFTSGFAWNHLAVAWDGSYCYGYLNGANVTPVSVTGIPDWSAKPLYLGTGFNLYNEFFNGTIDELRISNVSRSQEWIKTSHDNQKDPSSFYTVGDEESSGLGPPLYIHDESPADGSTGQYTNPLLSATVSDSGNGLLTVLFRTNASGTWEDVRVYQGVGSGTYSTIPTDMGGLGVTYFWSVCASDGNTWANETYSFSTTTNVLVPKWNKSDPRGGISGVLVADVNGDGSEDVIYAGGNVTSSASAPGYVTARSGIDGSIIWQHSDPAIGFWVQPQMADVNNDGILEVLVPLQGPVGVLVLRSSDGAQLARRTGLGGVSFSSPVSCDIDGDGYQEIFFCSTDTINGLNSTGRLTSLRYDESQTGNLRILNQIFAWRPCSGGLSIADTDFDGEFELYMGDRYMYKEDGGYGKGVASFWATNLTERWNRPEVHCSSNIPMLADVTGDGILDVISGYMNGGVYVLNSTDGSIINQKVINSSQLPVHYQPSIYDIDHDGHLEMLMADGEHAVSGGPSSNDTVILDLVTMTVDKRLVNTGRCFYGPQVADVTGDGVMDIIACNYTGYISVFNSSYSLIGNTYLPGAYILNYAVVQDIDNDEYNEVIVSSQSGRIYAFDTPARTPVPRPRSEIQFYSERRLGAAEYVLSPGCAEPVVTSVSPSNLQKNVPVSTNKLSFTLTDYQRNLMNYTVTTNPSVGSKSRSNVGNGRVEIDIGGLQYHTTYTWTVKVTDGSHWTNETYRFTTELFVPWWNSDWQCRRQIVVYHEKVSASLTDFPVLVDIMSAAVTGKCRPDGYDIVFTDGAGNKLDHEIEVFDSDSGHLMAWVRIPFLSSSQDTGFYMYYGNPSASNQQNPSGVWDANFVTVQHLEEQSGSTRYDSSSNNYDATVYGGVSKDLSGKIDGADIFDGVNDYSKFSTIVLPTSSITVELWLKPSSYSSTRWTKYINTGPTTNTGLYGGQSSLSKDYWALSLSWDSKAKYYTLPFTSGFAWNYLAVTWNGSYCYGYLNGANVTPASRTGTPDWSGRRLYMGTSHNLYEFFNGTIDEIRISKVSRSQGWIKTCYNNQKDPSLFCGLGGEDSVPQVPVVYAPSPSDDAVDVPTSLSQLSFDLVDLQGDLMDYSVSTYPNIGSGQGTSVANGRYNVSVSGIVRSTTYTWNITVTDVTGSDVYVFKFTSELGDPPTHGNPSLISQPGGNPPLVCRNQTTSDGDGDKVTNVYNWYRNDVSITNLLFSFDTNTSGSVKDYSGYGNDGTVVGSVQWAASGRVGGAYTFDRGYIKVLDGGLLDGRGLWTEMTIEFWVYATVSQSGTRVVAKIPSYEVGFTGSNQIFAGVWVDKLDGYTRVTSPSSLTPNVWYHIALTYKSGVGVKLYINGALSASSASITGNIKPCSLSEPLYIGWFDYFKGRIDEVRIYPRSLTSSQVSQRWNDTKGGLSSSSTIVSGETVTGESWRCQVTPNDSYLDGQTKSSVTVIIGSG